MPPAPETFRQFWPYYLAEHRRRSTRLLHYVGTGLGLALLATAIATRQWWLLLAALVSGYAFAWASHAFIERNRPATFTYPLWSLISDFRMFFTAIAGRMGAELERHQIRE